MKLLLDENLPHDLRHLLPPHEVFTVYFMGWSGIINGVLLQLAADHGFDALLTLDSGIEYQHNLLGLPCSVVILHSPSNKLADIQQKLNELMRALDTLPRKTLVRVGKSQDQ